MRDADNTTDVRLLSDAELNDVSGGHPAIIIAVALGVAAWGIGLSGPNVGTMQEQAAKLGLSHLL